MAWRIKTLEEFREENYLVAHSGWYEDSNSNSIPFVDGMNYLYGVKLSDLTPRDMSTTPLNREWGAPQGAYFETERERTKFRFDSLGMSWTLQEWMCVWEVEEYLSVIDVHSKISIGDFIIVGKKFEKITNILRSKQGKIYVNTDKGKEIPLAKSKIIGYELIKEYL